LLIEGGKERTGMSEEKERRGEDRMSEERRGEGEEDQVDARFSSPPKARLE
jgi:hypothetical protein